MVPEDDEPAAPTGTATIAEPQGPPEELSEQEPSEPPPSRFAGTPNVRTEVARCTAGDSATATEPEAGEAEDNPATSHTNAAAPISPDSGNRDSIRATTGSTARTHRPPIEATDTITESLR